MSFSLILLMLAAAALHAAWNVVVKAASDQRAEAVLVAIAAALIAAAALPFVPIPIAAAWPWLAGSVMFQFLYFQVLGRVYRHAELSYAYPLMRGAAPLLTALVSAVAIGEQLSTGGWIGVLLLCAGVLVLCADRFRSGGLGWSITGFGLLNAALIAAYTIVDGIGIRISAMPLSYVCWLFFLNSMPFLVHIGFSGPRRFLRQAAARWPIAFACGLCMTVSYGIAIWAMTKAPLGPVAALRETSVLFATAFAAIFLKERFGPPRYAAAALVVAGAVMMRLW